MKICNNNTLNVSSDGKLRFNKKVYKCAIGKSGLLKNKREGDGTTPIGTFSIREIFYRADRIAKPKSRIRVSSLTPNDAWSDDPENVNYNKKVMLPHNGRTERLWRKDHVYDIIVVIGYNDKPPIKLLGSAIFLHIAKNNYEKTEGCIAVEYNDLIEIISNMPETCFITISPAI